MGSSRYDPKAYATYTSSTHASGKVRASMSHTDYTATSLKSDYDPKQIKVRESVKSDANPHPTPVIVALDVTGSMGLVVEAMRKGLGTLFEQIIEREPVSDPHVMAMAIGDMDTDRAPVQATQFEADPVTIGKQIEDLYLERGGGSNDHESYLGPLYFAAMRTKCDAFKEKRKGFLFTVGDEEPQDVLTKAQLEKYFGDQAREDLSAEQVIAMIERDWHYFHIIVEEGYYARVHLSRVRDAWARLLGQRVIHLSDHDKMAEVIVSAIEVTVGRDKDTVSKSWSGDTSVVVAKAIGGLPAAKDGGTSAPGPVTL